MQTTDLKVSRYLVHVEVYDSEIEQNLVLEQYNCSHLRTAEETMRRAARELRELTETAK